MVKGEALSVLAGHFFLLYFLIHMNFLKSP